MSKPILTKFIKTVLPLSIAVLFGIVPVVAQSSMSASVNGLVDNAEVKLFGNGQQAFDIFGGSVDVSDGRTIVGSRWADVQMSAFSSASNAGAAYIFSQDVNGRYREDARLQPTDIAAGDEFGNSVAISGTIAVVGAYGHDGDFGRLKLEDSGAVYVYTLRSNGNWSLEAKLEPSDASAGLSFGRSVAIENNTIVIGAAGAGRNNTGAVYVYEFDMGEWVEGEQIVPPYAQQGDEIGSAVAISGNTILVSGAGANGAGTAYIYRRKNAGFRNGWQVEAALSSNDNSTQTFFGYSVALDGDIALVGALGDDGAATDAGAAYVFERQSNGDWKAAGKLTATDASRDDKLGGAVALENGLAVIASEQNDSMATDAGAVYFFSRQSEGNWQLVDKVSAVDANRADHFGSALALENAKLAVGALRDDDLAENSGSTYVYDISSLSQLVRSQASQASSQTPGQISVGNTRGNVRGATSNSTGMGATENRLEVSNTARPVLAPALSIADFPATTELDLNVDSDTGGSNRTFEEIRASGNFGNLQQGQLGQGQLGQGQLGQGQFGQGQLGQGQFGQGQFGQGQFGQGQFSQSQFNDNQYNQGMGSNNSVSRNLGSNQGLNNQGFGTQGLNNQGFGNQGLNNQGLGQGLNQGLNSGSGLNRNFNSNQGLGQNQGFNNEGFNNQGFNNQGLGQTQGFGTNSGLNNNTQNNSPLFAAPSGSLGSSSNNNNFGTNQNPNQGEGFLGLGRFFRNPNRPQDLDDGIPRLSDITEQQEQTQSSGFLGLGKLRNLGMGNLGFGNRSNQSQTTTNLNRDTRNNQGFNNQGFNNQGFNNQGFGNQGFNNQGFNNQGFNNQGFGNQGFNNQGFNNQGLNNQGLNNQGFNNQNSYSNNSSIMNLRNQVSRVGDVVELELPLFTTPVTYLSSGLPQGLQLDPREGIIFGEIARGSVGDYNVLIQVDDGQNQLTEGFTWQVNR